MLAESLVDFETKLGEILLKDSIDKNRLTIPIYLNTKVVFDMLATIEDGFSEVKSIQTSQTKEKEINAEANVGTSNLFALLNIAISGGAKKSSNDSKQVAEERTHTTVSLFQKLKVRLEEAELIKREIDWVEVGDFVEIGGTFKTNPLIDLLNGLKEIMILVDLFSENKSKNNKTKSQKVLADNKFNNQIDGLIKGLQADGKKDIICFNENMRVVLPTDENYFLNSNMSEVTEGNYKVLGKVVRICKDEGEISLLRNTAFSKLKLDKMEEFQNLFNDPSLSQFVENDGITTSVKAPVMMVIPIAIYI